MALQCQNRKLLFQFIAQVIYVLAKTNLGNLRFWPFSPGSIKLAQLFLGWIANQESVFRKTFHGPSMLQHETPATVFGWTNVPFRQINLIKAEISSLWLAGTNLGEFFFLVWIGNQESVLPQPFYEPFSVTRWNSYHSFCLNQYIF